MKLIRKFAKNRVLILGFALAFLIAIGTYFFFLLKQVEVAFETQNEFIPTRIYSSVERVAPPLARGIIEHKLHALGYNLASNGADLSFTLHSSQYPEYLIPENHPTLALKDKVITLRFDGTDADSTLSSIDSETGPKTFRNRFPMP
jgi:hypothetical protein